MSDFLTLEDMVSAAFESARPAERLTVSQAAERYHIVRRPGMHSGPFDNSKTPYLVEPMNTLTSLDYTGMIFVGPARTGKSAMALNWLAHTAVCDPNDMMFVHMTQATARDWSQDDLAKMLRDSPEIRARLKPGRQNDNVHDKKFISGMNLLIKWPTITELSGKTKRYNWLFDYDRIDDDIDGEGNAYDLTKKRAATFKRFGMTVAESSPGREVDDPKWMAKSPHEAPPTKGVLELYNRGDRRRWYWQCPQCRESFEPSFKLLHYPASNDVMESAEQVTLVCPHDGFPMEPSFKEQLNQAGRWVKDGMIWLPDNTIVERTGMRAARSDIASFWMKGPAAAFQDWDKLVANYLNAMKAFESTADEEALKVTINVDQGEPYTPQAKKSERVPEELKMRAEDWGATEEEPTIPWGVRFIKATVDVQARAFVVQVHGTGPGNDFWFIDAFKIRKSKRLDEDGDPHPIDPASYPEDWDVLIEQVIEKSYPLADGSGRRMAMRLTGCDMGGEAGVSTNAYNFWRRLRDDPEGRGHHRRFALIKGEPSKSAPRAQLRYPDSSRKDRNSGARGDVPVLFLNSNTLKDAVDNMLGRTEPGGGMIRFPTWLPDFIYTQLTTEVRIANKGWVNLGRRRNEALDLLYYFLGLCVRQQDSAPWPLTRLEQFNWDEPPSWAKDWDENDLVFAEDDPVTFVPRKPARSFADLGSDLA